MLDTPTILADLAVITVPSRQEPLSRVLLESLALGVPAVATDVGGSAEILQPPLAGLTVPVDDPAALAAAVERLLDDAGLADRFRRSDRSPP